MRARSLFLPVLTLAALHLSCPRPDDAPPIAPATPAPAPIPATAPVTATAPTTPPATATPTATAPVTATGPVTADLASLAVLPPELVDDGVDDIPELEPPPPPARAAAPASELASTARETWIFTEPRWGSRR